jgi:hypothetical protein
MVGVCSLVGGILVLVSAKKSRQVTPKVEQEAVPTARREQAP